LNNNVDHPGHYNKGIEAIDVIESWDLNFNVGNVIKYMLRAPFKGESLQRRADPRPGKGEVVS
jgi:hypothetical protein